jgi:hypothetical protein
MARFLLGSLSPFMSLRVVKKPVARLPNLPLIFCLSFFTGESKDSRRTWQPAVTSKENGRLVDDRRSNQDSPPMTKSRVKKTQV